MAQMRGISTDAKKGRRSAGRCGNTLSSVAGAALTVESVSTQVGVWPAASPAQSAKRRAFTAAIAIAGGGRSTLAHGDCVKSGGHPFPRGEQKLDTIVTIDQRH